MPRSATKASSGNPLPADFYGRCGKRVLDFTVALLSLVCLIPLFAILAVLLVVIQRTPPFFLQKRIGRGLKPFYIIKFKTMKDTRDAEGRLLPDEQRTTFLGSLLRRTSLDELPELVNVLLGDMSFIGPRPWIPEQMAIFTPSTRKKRMAQIHGRNNLTFRQRVCYDLRYKRHLSFRYDLNILLYTFYKVIKEEGIHQRPDALGKPALTVMPKDPHTRGLRGNSGFYNGSHQTETL
ncbi:sugar transferase [Akkermansia sp.]|uniref:sugar transferase n=1 Tax=Akkermansia sp. TaxID=1872421 RepID=UPI0027B9E2E2|nr:sugar transferase [Akkermansia sp.]